MKNQEYFTQISDEYQRATHDSAELYENIGVEIGSRLSGKVIDFGSGGVINYDTSAVDKLVCVDIVNENTELSDAEVDFVYGDFYDYEFPPDADFAIAQFLLHHLPDDARVEASLSRLANALPDHGKLIVIEMVMPGVFEKIQNALRPVLEWALSAIERPMLRFFSLRSLSACLERAGFETIQVRSVDIGERVSPAPVLFPNLRIPGRWYPMKCVIVEAQR